MKIYKLFKYIFTVLIALIIHFNLLNYSYSKELDSFKLTAIDVGQGDSLLIKTPNNNYGLIDAGIRNNILTKLPDLLPVGFRKLKFIIMTHPDSDHIEGFIEILSRYEVENVFFNKSSKENAITNKIDDILQTKNIKSHSLDSKNDFILDDVTFDIVWPFNKTDDLPNSNDNSISMVISYKELDIYTSGDLSTEYEIESLKDLDKEIEVLKVGHHGSKTSTTKEFLDLLMPEIALISLGKDNSYGHPHYQVLSDLNSINSKIYRTDNDGSIEVLYNNKGIIIKTSSGINERFAFPELFH